MPLSAVDPSDNGLQISSKSRDVSVLGGFRSGCVLLVVGSALWYQ